MRAGSPSESQVAKAPATGLAGLCAHCQAGPLIISWPSKSSRWWPEPTQWWLLARAPWKAGACHLGATRCVSCSEFRAPGSDTPQLPLPRVQPQGHQPCGAPGPSQHPGRQLPPPLVDRTFPEAPFWAPECHTSPVTRAGLPLCGDARKTQVVSACCPESQLDSSPDTQPSPARHSAGLAAASTSSAAPLPVRPLRGCQPDHPRGAVSRGAGLCGPHSLLLLSPPAPPILPDCPPCAQGPLVLQDENTLAGTREHSLGPSCGQRHLGGILDLGLEGGASSCPAPASKQTSHCPLPQTER